MNHLQMAEVCEQRAQECQQDGNGTDAALWTDIAKHHREKHEEMTRTKHREEAAEAAAALVKTEMSSVESKIAVLTAELNKSKAEVSAVQQRELKSLATKQVESAISDGYLIPAKRQWGIDLCLENPAAFAAFVKDGFKMPHGIENFEAERRVGTVVVSAQEMAVCAEFQSVSVEDYAVMREKNIKKQGVSTTVAHR